MSVVRKIVTASRLPNLSLPFSHAVIVDKTMYISGQIGMDPATLEVVPGGITTETHQALKNIGAVLEAAGIDYSHVVKVTVLLANIGDFAAVNSVYEQYFKSKHPARACYQVGALPRGALVEIEAVAVVGTIEDV